MTNERKTKYFGPEHRRKEYEIQIPVPVGEKCIRCDEAIAEGDIGSINMQGYVEHYECQMRAVVGSVGHQKGLCSCYGGTEEDPRGMTRREAVIAACKLWHAVGTNGTKT
jgi:hypothetical protein